MTQRNPIAPARRLIAAGITRRLPGRTITVRATEAGVTGSSISKAARIAELHKLCAEDYASSAHRRGVPATGNELLAAEPSGRRCPATFPADPTPCRGPVAVTVLDKDNAGADGCEYHAARLLAVLDGGRVYGLPDAPDGAAVRVFRAAVGGAQ